MQCPQCNVPLMMTERKNVEIDFCPQCRGVWLDKGELDKIIELSVADRGLNSGGRSHERPSYREPRRDHYHQSSHDHYHQRRPYYKKKKSKLSEIFDIFD
jgi:Zn-finger nucleic acid-binding protein